MTHAKLVNYLNQMTGLRAYYRQVPIGTSLPFICWRVSGTSNMAADNKVHKMIETILVDLYTSEKSFSREQELEQIFANAELYWDKSEITLDTEAVTMVTYTLEIQIEY